MKHLGFASLEAVQQYLSYARKHHFCCQSLLRAASLPPDLAQQRQGRITGLQFQALLVALQQMAQDPLMGFNSAQCFMPEFYGIVGKISRYCTTLGEAIDTIPQFERLVGDMGTSNILKYANHWELSWDCRYPAPSIRHHMVDNVFASWTQFARMLLTHRQTQHPKTVYLSAAPPTPENMAVYQRFYGCPVHFAADSDKLLLADSTLALPLQPQANADQQLNTLKGHARSSLSSLCLDGESFSHSVTRAIKAHLNMGSVHKALIAQEFNLSLRQLQRRLAQEHTSYQQLLDQARKQRAQELKNTGNFSITELAYNLGYQDERSYYRSAKRWFNP